MAVALGKHTTCSCGQGGKISSSLRVFRVTQQKKSMRPITEQKLGCHFKVTSDLPARLYLQVLLLDF